MDNRNPQDDEHYDELGAQSQAARFEASIAAEQPIFMDISAVENVYSYYRIHAEGQKALRLVSYALEIYPLNGGLHHKLAILQVENGKLQDSLDSIDTALNLMPTHPDFLSQKARVLSLMGRSSEAFELMEQALSLHDNRAELYYQLGMLHQQEKNYLRAIAAFRQAMEEDPEYEYVLSEIIFCYELSQDAAASQAFLESYLDDNPFSSTAWYNLGMFYLRAGQFEHCVQAMDYAITLQADFTSPYQGKGTALMEMGRYDLATRVFLDALSYERKDISLMLNLAECYEVLKQHKRARFYYQKVTDLYEGIPDAWYGIASTLENEEKHYLAITYYKKAIEQYEEYYEAWVGLAECEYEVGNFVSASEAFARATQIVPDDIALWQDWAEKMMLDGDVAGSLELLLAGIEANDTAASLHYQYAAYCLRHGKDTAGAYQYLENALIMDYDAHGTLYEYFPELRTSTHVQRLIAQYAI